MQELAQQCVDSADRLKDWMFSDGADTKPPLSDYKDALDKVHGEVGKLPKGEDGKFGSPQAGDSKRDTA